MNARPYNASVRGLNGGQTHVQWLNRVFNTLQHFTWKLWSGGLNPFISTIDVYHRQAINRNDIGSVRQYVPCLPLGCQSNVYLATTSSIYFIPYITFVLFQPCALLNKNKNFASTTTRISISQPPDPAVWWDGIEIVNVYLTSTETGQRFRAPFY